MQFKGTFSIRHFKELQRSRDKLIKAQRSAFQIAFWDAIGRSVLDYGLRIPVLTGDTRKGVYQVLKLIDMRLLRAGGTIQFAPALDYDTMTEAKSRPDHYPKPVSNVDYRSPVWWKPDTREVKIKSRKEWRYAVEAVGHYPDGDIGAQVDATGIGSNAYVGSLTFFMSHGPAYWQLYDQGKVGKNRGPWNLVEHFEAMVRAFMNNAIEGVADGFLESVFEAGINIKASGISHLDVGQMSAVGLREEGKTSVRTQLGRFGVDFYQLGLSDDEVPF